VSNGPNILFKEALGYVLGFAYAILHFFDSKKNSKIFLSLTV